MKTIEVIKLFQILNVVKLTNLSLEGKFNIIRTVKRCKEVVNSINVLIDEAKERLKPNDFEFPNLDSQYELMSDEDKVKLDKITKEYSNQVNACIEPELDKEVSIEIEKISQEDFGLLMEQNDWNVETLILLNDYLVKSDL